MDGISVFLFDNRYILIAVYLTLMNISGFILCGMDKLFAIKGMPRISERILLAVSLAAGASGMLLGMVIFRHKTRKQRFIILIPMFILIHLCIFLWLEERYYFLSQLFL